MYAAIVLALVTTADAKDLGITALTAATAVPEKGVVNVVRTIEIAAAPELVYAYASDYRAWPGWTAWNETKYPGIQWVHEGDAGTVGHATSWDGKKSGKGRMALTAASAPTELSYDLWFGKAKDPSKGRITITSTATGSKVEWQDVMSWGFPMSCIFPAKKMNAMIGAEFDEGLQKLKTLAEADAAKAAEAARVEAERKAAEEAAKAAEEARLAAEKAAADAEAARLAAEAEAAKGKKKK